MDAQGQKKNSLITIQRLEDRRQNQYTYLTSHHNIEHGLIYIHILCYTNTTDCSGLQRKGQ